MGIGMGMPLFETGYLGTSEVLYIYGSVLFYECYSHSFQLMKEWRGLVFLCAMFHGGSTFLNFSYNLVYVLVCSISFFFELILIVSIQDISNLCQTIHVQAH